VRENLEAMRRLRPGTEPKAVESIIESWDSASMPIGAPARYRTATHSAWGWPRP